MKIRIICVGKIKEKFYREAAEEYKKRLSAYTKVEIIELKDEKAPADLSKEGIERIKEKEAEAILSKLSSYPSIALDPRGRQFTSEALAENLDRRMQNGQSTINFIIGGSNGLTDSVRSKCDLILSFSELTFPHQLFRVMLLEQIYRSFKIIRGETYHK